jgi:hypothetical protein
LNQSELKTERVFYLFFFLLLVSNFLMHGADHFKQPLWPQFGARLGVYTLIMMVLFIDFNTFCEKPLKEEQASAIDQHNFFFIVSKLNRS